MLTYDFQQYVQNGIMEREQGKLTSQERFWQARFMSKESEHRAELSSIHEKLDELTTTTELAKTELANIELAKTEFNQEKKAFFLKVHMCR